MTTDRFLNDFAIRCFSDIADGDYIAARMASRAQLVVQYLWASQQAIEKYLKCVLLLHRIPAPRMFHNLASGLTLIEDSGKLKLDLTARTGQFIRYLDQLGRYRYFEVSNFAFGDDIVNLDRAVWELRRFCTMDPGPRQEVLRDGFPAPKILLPGRYLERIMEAPKHPAREPLLWQNAFFGKRMRQRVRLRKWWKASNSPLYLNPQMLDEVTKYVHLPKNIQDAYRALKNP